MKITKKIENYIITHEMPIMDNIYNHILQKEEKLLFSLPLTDIDRVIKMMDVGSNAIPFVKGDFACLFRMHYWTKEEVFEKDVDYSHFVLFTKDSVCEKRGLYQYILTFDEENQSYILKLLTEKPLAISIEDFLKRSSGVFLDTDLFIERVNEYQKLPKKFADEYYDVEETKNKVPQSLFDQVSFFVVKYRELFPNLASTVPLAVSERISILKTKLQLAKYINEFSCQSIALNEQSIHNGNQMFSNLAELLKNNLLTPPVLFFQEFKEQIVSKSRYFNVYMMQKRGEVVMGDKVGTLKISNVNDSCVLCTKETLVKYSEKETLEKLQECWKKANEVVALYLLPAADKPLAATYKLAINKATETVETKLTI